MLTADSDTEYGKWTDPETSFYVKYPLPLFYEIDFLVVETYRRIPRGGIEIGALLFGQPEPGGIRIESFRSIHCDHALGPSFKLSESDLAALRLQLQTVQTEQAAGGPQLLGWFIAHTRNPLELNPAEAALFDELLPGAGKLTLLIKPEKFKPTLFAFLVRRDDGQVPQAVEDRTMILPLTAPAAQNSEEPPVAVTDSSPARAAPVAETPPAATPADSPATPEPPLPVTPPSGAAPTDFPPTRVAPRPVIEPPAAPTDFPPTRVAPRPVIRPAAAPTDIPPTTIAPMPVVPRVPPAAPAAHSKPADAHAPAGASSEDHIAAVRKAVISARQMASAEPLQPLTEERDAAPADRMQAPVERVAPPPLPQRESPPRPQRSISTNLRETGVHPFSNLPVPVEPAWPIDAYPAPTFDAGMGERMVDRRPVRLADEYNAQSKLQFAAVMIVAAALGCALGYLAYLQLPSPVIPLNIQPEAAGLTVYWPPEQTRSAVYAAIRINDGEPVPLPGDAKTAGHSRITAAGDVIKVELIAQHWMRDSRGIVRFVTAVKQPSTPAAAVKPRRKAPSRPFEIPRPEEPSDIQQR